MVYQWKIPGLYNVDAQTAGEELDRIYREHGALEPERIVDESRDEGAPLHGCFEWNDSAAAEKYRQVQAAGIVHAIITAVPGQDREEPVSVRAFVHVEPGYQPIAVVINDEEKLERLQSDAIRELKAFQRKYNVISALSPVFDAIDSLST